MTRGADMLVATVVGIEMALLVGSTCLLPAWSFERGEAQALVTKAVRCRVEKVHDAISEQTRKAWNDAGVWKSPTARWTRDFIRRRSVTSIDLRLSREQLETAVVCLRATHAEFSTNWDEFCVASPGAIDWYPGAAPQSLLDLADKLESVLASA